MAFPEPSAFRVIDRPYVVWSYNARAENFEFLDSIDSDFYHRTAQTFFFNEAGELRFDPEDSGERKDVSSFARLVWNHGLETLITLLGALVQAPHAVHGFFLKCENKDCRKIAQYLLSSSIPEDNCLIRLGVDFEALVRGIHARPAWANDAEMISNLTRALRAVLAEYDRDDLRFEYNSIKHGLRASHGRFAIAVGLQEAPGIPAPEENMSMLSDSQDGSHFLMAKSLPHATKKAAREQFSLQRSSVGWSLEKTLFDIQLFSSLIGNVVGALKIASGAKPSSVHFYLPQVDADWWEAYFAEQGPDVQNFSFGGIIEAPKKLEDAERRATKFYRAKAAARKQSNAPPD
jgi:hypothetical protein